MSVPTILLFAFIALLAFKGLLGDSYRPPVSYPHYPSPSQAPNSIGLIAGLLIAVASLWLLLQIPSPQTEPAPQIEPVELQAPPVPQTADERYNQPPSQDEFLETTEINKVHEDNLSQSENFVSDRDVGERTYHNQPPQNSRRLAVALRCFENREDAERLVRHFQQRNIQIFEIATGEYLACIPVETLFLGYKEVEDWNARMKDWVEMGLNPQVVYLKNY